jgi:hypothetical protein
METQNTNDNYFIWGRDEASYGPVPQHGLIDWINIECVQPDTWVYSHQTGHWRRALEVDELKAHFVTPPAGTDGVGRNGIKPASLRRIKILAEMNDLQLAHLAEFLELQEVKPWTVLFQQNDPGDAMFLVLAGELRARVMVSGREAIIAHFGAGDFFGDLALFDHGPRSADMVANTDCTLLKLTAAAFDRLTREAPALSTPFLQATIRTLAARIRADNKRLTGLALQYSSMAPMAPD